MKDEVRSAKGQGVLVCFAVREEATAFRKSLKPSDPVRVVVTGMGQRNAERAFREAVAAREPAVVVTCGFAGALDPKLRVGDVIFSAIDPTLHDILVRLGARPSGFHCSTTVASTAAEKETLRRATGLDAVEMESGVIQALCRESGIFSCATVRVISDTASEDLPLDFNALMTSDQRISMVKLACALIRSPGRIPGLLRLRRNTQLAADRLAEVLGGLLRSLNGRAG